MSHAGIEEISKFFSHFRSIREANGRVHAERYVTEVPFFISGFNCLYESLADNKRKFTPDYNLFEILRIRTRETAVHTPFLFNLLQTHANHHQGNLFIYSFLKDVIKIDGAFGKFKVFEVAENKVTVYGNLDMLITVEIDGRPFAIVIENKIYAADQDRQLERYFLCLRETLNYDASGIRIVYLSPSGVRPSKRSIRNSLYRVLRQRGILKEISYHFDIFNWLTDSSSKIEPTSILYLTIQQYLKLIKTL